MVRTLIEHRADCCYRRHERAGSRVNEAALRARGVSQRDAVRIADLTKRRINVADIGVAPRYVQTATARARKRIRRRGCTSVRRIALSS